MNRCAGNSFEAIDQGALQVSAAVVHTGYNPLIVALSIAIAIFTSYTALDLGSCVSACNNGSDSLCVQLSDETGAEKIEVGTPVHLALHELELRDLSLGLTVRPWLREGRRDCGIVGRKADGKG